jgi:short subunit fatty acids transporter
MPLFIIVMPLFIIESRPPRYLFFVFSLGILLDAKHGNAYGVAIAAIYFGLLLWRSLLDAARQLREAAHQASVIAG